MLMDWGFLHCGGKKKSMCLWPNFQCALSCNIDISIEVCDSKMWQTKGQLISKANCQAVNSSKKRTNEFVFTTMRRVFVRFLEEIEDS